LATNPYIHERRFYDGPEQRLPEPRIKRWLPNRQLVRTRRFWHKNKRDGYRTDRSYFGTEEEAAATAADAIDNGSNEEENILRAVLDTWKMIKRKARRNLFIIGYVTVNGGGFLIAAGIFLFFCLELFYRTTEYPMYVISVGMLVAFIGMQCISVCDVDMDAMLKAHPVYAKFHVSALLVCH
jgi:hypothetical protein